MSEALAIGAQRLLPDPGLEYHRPPFEGPAAAGPAWV